jgi:hypothetical protein
VDCGLTGETLPLLPDHPLKWPDLVLFGVVQSQDQMAASHLEGLLAGPDSSRTRVLIFCFCESGESHCSPGLTPSSRTTPTHRYARLCTAHMLCRAFPAPPGLSGAPALVCLLQTCCLQLLTCFACLQVVCSVGAGAANALPDVCPPSGDRDREASSQLVLSAAV